MDDILDFGEPCKITRVFLCNWRICEFMGNPVGHNRMYPRQLENTKNKIPEVRYASKETDLFRLIKSLFSLILFSAFYFCVLLIQ